MKTLNYSKSLLLIAGTLFCASVARAQHGHLNAGALGKNQNDKLYFANGTDFINDSGYVKTLSYTNGGRFAGFYEGNITLTVLPTTAEHAGPDPNAPAPGSFIQAQLVSVDGPTGGSFGFWEAGSTAATYSLLSAESGTNTWPLTESDGAPGSDPYGHIHGRRFTATVPGIYTVGFKLFDTSTNGLNAGPIHAPSDVLLVYFQAGVGIQSVEPDAEEGHVHIRFAPPAETTWQVEASDKLGLHADWQPAGSPVAGHDVLVEMLHDRRPGEQRFYRLRRVTP